MKWIIFCLILSVCHAHPRRGSRGRNGGGNHCQPRCDKETEICSSVETNGEGTCEVKPNCEVECTGNEICVYSRYGNKCIEACMGGCPEGQECLQTGFLGSDYSCQDPPDCSASSCLANERCVNKSNTACVVPVCDPVCSADKKCILDEEGNPNCEERPPPNCNDGCESPNECKWIPLTSTCKDLNCGENGPCTDDQVCFRGVCLETPNCNGHCDDATQKCVYKKKRSWLVPRPICQNLPWYRHGCEENKVRFQRQCLDIPTCDNSCDANTQECQYYLNSIGGLGQKCRTIPKCGEGCAIHQKCEFKRTECSEW